MYRPEGLYDTLMRSPFAQEYRDSPARLEFALDAILEGLIKGTPVIYKNAGTVSLGDYGTLDSDKPGYLIFIPEE